MVKVSLQQDRIATDETSCTFMTYGIILNMKAPNSYHTSKGYKTEKKIEKQKAKAKANKHNGFQRKFLPSKFYGYKPPWRKPPTNSNTWMTDSKSQTEQHREWTGRGSNTGQKASLHRFLKRKKMGGRRGDSEEGEILQWTLGYKGLTSTMK